MKKILNPYYVYIWAFGLVLVLNALKWSEYLFDITWPLFFFLIITFIISYLFGTVFQNKHKIVYMPGSDFSKKDKNRIRFILIGYCLEFLYAQEIPLLRYGFSNIENSFTHFGGIPTFHVILVTYSVYYSCVYFYKLLSHFSYKRFAIFLTIAIVPSVLMINRGMLFSIIITCVILFVLSLRNFTRKYFVYISIVIFICLYGFAFLGKMKIGDDSDNSIFKAYTLPTENFEKTGIPAILLWPYIYASSPISNLELCVSQYTPQNSATAFVAKCIIPDFISGRIYDDNLRAISPPLITPVFNVSTMYYSAYVYYGWIGMVLLFIYHIFMISISLFSCSIRTNENYPVLYALVCTIVLLNTFANMWVFSAISFPIVWVYLDNFLKRIKWSR